MITGRETIDFIGNMIASIESGDEDSIAMFRRILHRCADAAPPVALVKIAKSIRDIRMDDLIDEERGGV